MIEVPLIIIALSPRQHIGFTVKAGEIENRIIDEFRAEIADTLSLLAKRLQAGEYPFSRLSEGEVKDSVVGITAPLSLKEE